MTKWVNVKNNGQLKTAAICSFSPALSNRDDKGAAPRSESRGIIMGNNFRRTSWLFTLEDIHTPSVYLGLNIKEEDRKSFVKGRVSEALRLANKSQRVLPYLWYKYQDNRDKFLTKKDASNTIMTIVNLGANGLIIWGSSKDVNSEQKCKQVQEYLNDVLGPIIKQFTMENGRKIRGQ